ncbi:MAG: hypothetical protein WC965_11770 [Thiohalomonadaceae bacterium]
MIFLDTLEQKRQELTEEYENTVKKIKELTDNLLKLEGAIIIINNLMKKEKEA